MMRAIVGVVALLVLASCVERAPTASAPTPEPTAPASARAPKIVDMCAHASNDPICVLRDDGRVSCAHIDDHEFAPPLAGIEQAVEIACGKHSICAREADGSITCLDDQGELRQLDSLAQSRSLAPDCAVSQAGELHCWDERWEPTVRTFPRLSAALDHDALDLQRVPKTSGIHACALRRDGKLWCWEEMAKYDQKDPIVVADLSPAERIRELRIKPSGVCWRGAGAWSCTEGTQLYNGNCEDRVCDVCEFSRGYCFPRGPDDQERPLDESKTVRDVVLSDGRCVVDLLDRVWCQSWNYVPVHELTLPVTSETTAKLEPVERQPPTPDPDPLPDPALSECPAATRITNRVCEHFTEPGGPLACTPDSERCRRDCVITMATTDEGYCEPEGFVVVDIHRGPGYVVYVDAPQVWIGPQLDLQKLEDMNGLPTVIELNEAGDDEGTHFTMGYELSSVILCDLVEGRPRCSSPIATDWSYEEIVTEDYDQETYGQVISEERIHYQADVTIVGADAKVKVRAGKRHADTEHRNVAGTRVLRSGSHPLAELLDQQFVYLPE
jgi:hypothetical protein